MKLILLHIASLFKLEQVSIDYSMSTEHKYKYVMYNTH
jgi:hypothetical protein